jgi:hypothetical protein
MWALETSAERAWARLRHVQSDNSTLMVKLATRQKPGPSGTPTPTRWGDETELGRVGAGQLPSGTAAQFAGGDDMDRVMRGRASK